MVCPKCGTEVGDGSAFCTKCGAALGGAANNSQGYTQPNGGNPENGSQQQNQGQQTNQAFQGNPYQGNPYQQGYGNGQQGYGYGYGGPQPYEPDPKDHTAEFTAKDISDNKVIAMMPYLAGLIGVIIALMVSKESPFVAFHVRQSLKIVVLETLLIMIMAVFCWTVVVPIAGAICYVILLVVRVISFVNICKGKAKEPAIVSSFGFLK